ncbi:MAG TPA: hypothetical protein VH442_14640 [Micromonosporaceae bacterium]
MPPEVAGLAAAARQLRAIAAEQVPIAELAEQIAAGKLAAAKALDQLAKYHTRAAVARDAGAVAERVSRAALGKLRDSVDTLIDEYRPRFEQAAAVVQNAAALGIRTGDAAEDVMRRGADTVAAYLALDEAKAILDAAAQIVGLADRDPDTWFVSVDDVRGGRHCRTDTMDGGGWHVRTDYDDIARLSWLDRAHAGHKIVLNDKAGADAVRRKSAAIEAGQAGEILQPVA